MDGGTTIGVAGAGVRIEDIAFTTRDGLRLHGRRYRTPRPTGAMPLLCLAGLTRNGRDFHDIAVSLSDPAFAGARDVLTLDSRGRGLSEHDPDWRNYSVPIEMLDVQDFMTTAGIGTAAILGTSRGGLITMLLAAAQPGLVGPVILNDIGPVIETEGLLRIAGYVGRSPLPHSWDDAARIARDINRKQFPAVTDAQWMEVAHQFYNDRNGRPAPGYDAKLARALSVLDGPIPTLWPQFEALKRVPLMVLRGENSDLLSAATVEEMRRRHPTMTAATIPQEGHAPLLKDAPTIDIVRRFLASAVGSERRFRLAS